MTAPLPVIEREAELPASLTPPVSSVSQPFWDALRNRSLQTQSCAACVRRRFPPGPVCPHCSGRQSTWLPLDGHGVVFGWTRYHKRYVPDWPVPYVVVCASLDADVRVFGRLVSAGAVIETGLPIQLAVEVWSNGHVTPAFMPTSEVTP